MFHNPHGLDGEYGERQLDERRRGTRRTESSGRGPDFITSPIVVGKLEAESRNSRLHTLGRSLPGRFARALRNRIPAYERVQNVPTASRIIAKVLGDP